MYPLRRNRRLRTNEAIRSLVRETIITPQYCRLWLNGLMAKADPIAELHIDRSQPI